MAFWGDYFVYDGIPCTEFGLRLYEVNGVCLQTRAEFLMPLVQKRLSQLCIQ